MDEKSRRDLSFLKIYAVVSSVLLIGLIYMAARRMPSKIKFDEIDAERINIVDKDGTLRLAIANRDRSPGVVIDGKYIKSREGQERTSPLSYSLMKTARSFCEFPKKDRNRICSIAGSRSGGSRIRVPVRTFFRASEHSESVRNEGRAAPGFSIKSTEAS